MRSQLAALPLIDRSDFDSLLLEGRFGPWSQQARDLHNHGFCILDLSQKSVFKDCERLVEVLSHRLARDLDDWEAGKSGSTRIQDGWRDEPAVRGLALNPQILDLLRHLYGRDPFAFQTLNFAVGSEQPYHSDAVHFHSEPHGFMCGVWIPLADVEPDSGPLVYYPGSHRLPYRSAANLGLSPDQVSAEMHPQRFFEPGWSEDVNRLGLKPQLFLPRRGQALIWHANLLHGGSPVANRVARRWSQVVHYYFKGCLYTTPMKSFRPEQGGTCFRQPFNIATGRSITFAMQRSSMDMSGSLLFKKSYKISTEINKLSKRWFDHIRSFPKGRIESGLKGNLELISPSLITGWVYNPGTPLSDVRLICGSQLLAVARIDCDRPDVNTALGFRGTFGFRLDIPDSHPEPRPEESLQILAFSADGSSRFPLMLPVSATDITEALLRLALASKYRGLRGHFDGLSPSGEDLIGWCYSSYNSSVSVWIHAEGIKPKRVPCGSRQPGTPPQLIHGDCGFAFPLSAWPEASGRRIWASFDEEGLLRLPPVSPIRLS